MSMLVNPYAPTGGGGTDPYFSNVVALLHFDGADTSTTFTNEVYPTRGNTFVRSNNAQLTTTNPLFGVAAGAMQTGAGLVSATHADYALGSGDWTIEFAVRAVIVGSLSVLFDMRVDNSSQVAVVIYVTPPDLRFFVSGADRISGGTLLNNSSTWQRIGLAKNSGTTRMFLDGTQVGSDYTDGNNYGQNAIHFSETWAGTTGTECVTDELRVTNGVGRYTGNYTVAAGAFPNS